MNFKLIRYCFVSLLTVISTQLIAQNNYRGEIGINVGSSFYIGDANKTIFKNQELTYGLIYRHKFNARLAASADWNYTKLSGSSIVFDNTTVTFNNPVNTLDVVAEFNFFDLEDKSYKPFSRKYSTYIFAGLGSMFYAYESKNEQAFSYPFGVGMKFMLNKKLNLNIKWSNRLMLSDQLEGISTLNNVNMLNGSNLFNNDLLSTLSIGLTFNVFKDRCNCNNNW